MKLRTIRPTAKIKRKKAPVKLKASASRTASRRAPVEDYEEDEEYYETSEPNMKLSHAFIVVLILHVVAVAGVFGFNAMKNRQNTLAQITAETATVAKAEQKVVESTTASAESTAPRSITTASPPSPAKTDAPTHEVVAGDTLTRIAGLHGTTVEALEKANNLNAESVLRIGQVLALPTSGTVVTASSPPSKPTAVSAPAPAPASTTPPAPATAATAAPVNTTPAAATASAEVYEVVAGDNPYSIAKRHGVSYQALLDLNGIDDPTKLQIGQKLKIPAGN